MVGFGDISGWKVCKRIANSSLPRQPLYLIGLSLCSCKNMSFSAASSPAYHPPPRVLPALLGHSSSFCQTTYTYKYVLTKSSATKRWLNNIRVLPTVIISLSDFLLFYVASGLYTRAGKKKGRDFCVLFLAYASGKARGGARGTEKTHRIPENLQIKDKDERARERERRESQESGPTLHAFQIFMN